MSLFSAESLFRNKKKNIYVGVFLCCGYLWTFSLFILQEGFDDQKHVKLNLWVPLYWVGLVNIVEREFQITFNVVFQSSIPLIILLLQ